MYKKIENKKAKAAMLVLSLVSLNCSANVYFETRVTPHDGKCNKHVNQEAYYNTRIFNDTNENQRYKLRYSICVSGSGCKTEYGNIIELSPGQSFNEEKNITQNMQLGDGTTKKLKVMSTLSSQGIDPRTAAKDEKEIHCKM